MVSFPCKRESSLFGLFWIPAFAGMTEYLRIGNFEIGSKDFFEPFAAFMDTFTSVISVSSVRENREQRSSLAEHAKDAELHQNLYVLVETGIFMLFSAHSALLREIAILF
jgi:hypothetical protein